jgi:ABC-type polar amino acid transport system ATPase subunit
LVTHHIEFARSLATRLIFMQEGRVIVDTPLADLERYARNTDFQRYLEPMSADL